MTSDPPPDPPPDTLSAAGPPAPADGQQAHRDALGDISRGRQVFRALLHVGGH